MTLWQEILVVVAVLVPTLISLKIMLQYHLLVREAGIAPGEPQQKRLLEVIRRGRGVANVNNVRDAIIAELQCQFEYTYVWDWSDTELFDGRPMTYSDFQDGNGGIIQRQDRIDMDKVAQAAVQAIQS